MSVRVQDVPFVINDIMGLDKMLKSLPTIPSNPSQSTKGMQHTIEVILELSSLPLSLLPDQLARPDKVC